MSEFLLLFVPIAAVVALALIWAFNAIKIIGPTEVGLVIRRWGKSLPADSVIALEGEAGYQAELLMPGLHFINWPIDTVKKYPWVQIPADAIGVVVAQVGKPLPIGAKSSIYKPEFGNFTDVHSFLKNGGGQGVQRPVLPPGTIVPLHPIAFLVLTEGRIYGNPISEVARKAMAEQEQGDFLLVRIEPETTKEGKIRDMVGIVKTEEGDPLPSGYIAGRLGNFDDVRQMEESNNTSDADIIEVLLGSKNNLHNNYQDFQKFLDAGGKIGLQHDPLLYGTYALNPYLIHVERVPMLVINQGEVAVVKSYVGQSTVDTSGAEFKFGSLVRPGHRGIWRDALRTGKYAINPRCYQAEIVPTAILTLNWAEAVSQAHNLDRQLSQIIAKSKEGFVFQIDLQVQIHVPDTRAPRVISTVGTMQNLVNEVLQAAVGNHFRDKLQSMEAIKFIETRQKVQEEAQAHITLELEKYEVETKGVYIQDVVLPGDLVNVLTQREIANQEIQTYMMQKRAEEQRIAMEKAKGMANQQAELARSEVGITIKANNAAARIREAEGEAAFTEQTGKAKGAEVLAVGLARAEGYAKQVEALGQQPTMMVNLVNSLATGNNKFVPEVLLTGGSSNGHSSVLDGLAALVMRALQNGKLALPTTAAETEKT